MKPTIRVIVSPAGETRIETAGFTGESCREATKRLEQALGTKSSERLTSEFYQAAKNQTEQQNTTQ